MSERYEDPADPLNGPRYHKRKPCIVKGCQNPAGTHWSPFWCQPHNAERMNRISGNFAKIVSGNLTPSTAGISDPSSEIDHENNLSPCKGDTL